MELWIRSQDKEILVKVNNLSLAFSNKDETCEIINSFEDHQCWELGTYKTKERTLEVLDEIQDILKPQILIRRNDDNDKVLLGGLQKGVSQKIDMEFKELSTYVYEMPKE